MTNFSPLTKSPIYAIIHLFQEEQKGIDNMDWELFFVIAVAVIGWCTLIIGKSGALDTTIHRSDADWERYYGKEDKKWGR